MTEIFLPVGGASHLEKAAPEQTAEQLFLTLLARFTRQGRNVSDKAASHGYALFRRVWRHTIGSSNVRPMVDRYRAVNASMNSRHARMTVVIDIVSLALIKIGTPLRACERGRAREIIEEFSLSSTRRNLTKRGHRVI